MENVRPTWRACLKSSRPAWDRLWDYVLKTKRKRLYMPFKFTFCFMCALWHLLPDDKSCTPNSVKLFRLSFPISLRGWLRWFLAMVWQNFSFLLFPAKNIQWRSTWLWPFYSCQERECGLFKDTNIYSNMCPFFWDFFLNTHYLS